MQDGTAATDAGIASLPLAYYRAEGRFTASDGVSGWREARLRRSPCYGAGQVEVQGTILTLRGWRRTWLFAATRAEILISLENVRNVVRDGASLYLEGRIGRRWRPVRFVAASEVDAIELCRLLPQVRTAGFDASWAELSEFNARLDAISPHAYVTPLLIGLNLAIFTATLIASRSIVPDAAVLSRWGANVGRLTVNGEWWRLLCSTFLHLGWGHVLVNMWALWGIGRFTERVYGSATYLLLYLAAGVVGSAASVAWSGAVMSVGASGAIFGVFGAFLTYLLRTRAGAPRVIVRAHRWSTMVFVVLNLLLGAVSPSIDNAAHVGGLIAGLALGWLLFRPLADRRGRPPSWRMAAAAVLTAATTVGGMRVGVVAAPSAPDDYAFFSEHGWYMTGEQASLRTWAVLGTQLAAGQISQAALGAEFKQTVLPFWETASRRLASEAAKPTGGRDEYLHLVLDFAVARRDWARAIVKASEPGGRFDSAEIADLRRANDLAQARLDRRNTRELADHGPWGLRTMLVEGWHTWRARLAWSCVEDKRPFGHPFDPNTAPEDGPALLHAARCDAQRKFMIGDYAGLDADLRRDAARLADLPDGRSTLTGAIDGLYNLFTWGGLDVPEVQRRLSVWRHAVPGSVYPELLEADLYTAWAWSARGHGTSNQVAAQSFALFGYRTLLASVVLDDIGKSYRPNPLWYSMRISNALDADRSKDEIRDLFREGWTRFPQYLPLYGAMLRALMPRWGGSEDAVGMFIDLFSDPSRGGTLGDRFTSYARLYEVYALLENDNGDFAVSGWMNWPRAEAGFRKLIEQSPRSDYLLNAFANLACLRGDAETYRSLEPQLEHRLSPTAWSGFISAAQCKAKFALPGGDEVEAQINAALVAARPLQDAVDGYVRAHGALPTDDTVRTRAEFRPSVIPGADVEMGEGASIEMRLRGGALDGHAFSWTPVYFQGKLTWRCVQDTVPRQYLPKDCR